MLEEGIRKLADGLPPGGKRRGYCPFCHADDEKSFSVVRDRYKPHMLWFRCFRGKCAEKGYVKDVAGLNMVLTGAAPLDEAARPMPNYAFASDEFLTMVAARYLMPLEYFQQQAVRYDAEAQGLCMPWLDEKGEQFGWVHKQFHPDMPKSKHDNVQNNASRLAWPRIGMAYKQLHSSNVCVIVEDLLSAYRINYEASVVKLPITSIALNGARISKADALKVAEVFNNVVVCLDYDQWPIGALEVLRQFYPLAVRQIATTLKRDPKDCEGDEIRAFLQELPTNF